MGINSTSSQFSKAYCTLIYHKAYLDEVALKKAFNEVQKDVLSVLRVALDAHDVVSLPENLNTCFL